MHPSKILPVTGSATIVVIFCSIVLQNTTDEQWNWQLINLAALIGSVIIFVGCVTSDVSLPTRQERRFILGSPAKAGGYNVEPLMAPRLDGWLLRVASWLVSHGLVGHLGRRPLINLQAPEDMRELAYQAGEECYPVVFYPFRRTISAQQEVTDAMAATCTDALQKGLPKSYDDDTHIGVMDYYEAYSAKKVTPSQMMDRVFEVMEQMEFMNMFVEVQKDKVLEQAKASDQRWQENKPLSVFDGVPVTIKDAICVKDFTRYGGMPRGSPYFSRAEKDDIMVKRLREAGAIILATTVTTEFGRCPLGYNSHYKGPFNPHDEQRYTGGSSSGSAVSVMTGIVPIGISFDGGGSIRIPAAFCGAYGLAPTFGRVPVDDGMWGNLHCGTITATTTDTALAHALLAQNEPNHSYTRFFDGGRAGGPPRPHLTDFDKIEDLSDIRIGVFWEYFNDCDDEIRDKCKETLQQLEKRGAKIVDIKIPHLNEMDMSHGMIISMEMSFIQEDDFFACPDVLEPATMIQLAIANNMTGVEFLAANRVRGWAMDYMQKLFAEKIDVFVTPACPVTAPRIPKSALGRGECNIPLMVVIMRYMFMVNLVGIPGMAIPIGYDDTNNLPISIQFMADHWNDALLLRLSHVIERKIFHRRAPKHFVKLSLE